MDVEEYVAARRGRLLEHAVALGCPEKDAADAVAWVLERQRRVIERAADPDPAVREALARHLAGEPERGGSRRTRAAVALGAAVAIVAAVAAVVVGGRVGGPTERVPSLFGYDVATATRVLREAGYTVETETAEACEPSGLVLGSSPVPGSDSGDADVITLRTAVPADPSCLATYGFRSDAWEFVRFARGGAAPAVAEQVTVYVDGAAVATLAARTAEDQASWPAALGLVEQAATEIADTRTAMPQLVVESRVPPPRLCGVPVPAAYAGRLSLRLQIDPSPEGGGRLCPFTVDLYRDRAQRIEAVAIYTGITRDIAP